MSKAHTLNENTNDKIIEFKQLLNKITTLEDKRKTLWLDVYTNALQDRDNAFNMYTQLAGIVMLDPTQHAVHGQNISKYIERMNKSNDQLLKLAELIDVAMQRMGNDESLSVDEIYERMADPPSKQKVSNAKG